ncbi:hypothetical protein V5N11_030899 [Cardamine amara subsp. amara]|uniref:DUF1985 domain-containing protein n=1 Tax=Cardamine amara subsp. amara TaxID=228776 RepID=A0ABD1B3G2_CARAN
MDEAKKFLRRLYQQGKSPLQNKSMNHNCQLGNFARVREAIGTDALEEIKKSSLGFMRKLNDSDYVWSTKTEYFLFTCQLAIQNEYEIWVAIGGQPIRFSLYDFAKITGLNTDAMRTKDCEADYTSFWTKLGVPHGVRPKYDELAKCFGRCPGWDLPEQKMLGMLCILHMSIHGVHHNSRIPLETAKRVFKDEDIADYPWGRVAFKSLIDGVKIVQYEGSSYTVNGCVHALLIWAYESITVFGERFGKVLQPNEISFLRCGGTRTCEDLDKVISKEIEEHGEVRVRRMIMKPLEEIYPT